MLVSTTCSECFETLSKLLIWVVRDFRLSVLARPLVSRSSWWLWIPKTQQENAALNSSLNFPVKQKKRVMTKNCKPCFNQLYSLEKKELSNAKLIQNIDMFFYHYWSSKRHFKWFGERQNTIFIRIYVRYGMKSK